MKIYKMEQQTQTKSSIELSQDITNDFHINFGWNVWRERENEVKYKEE